MRSRVPEWYRDAKLGIIVHWGVPAVPAYAPTEHGDVVQILREHDWQFLFRNQPRAEWYLNSLRIPESPARRYHHRHFGRHTTYERLARRFMLELDQWDPRAWADLFSESGARYVVMVGKHHDGVLMWPSETPPVSDQLMVERDAVGELAAAVREAGLKYGVSYSGLLDWTVQHTPITDYQSYRLPQSPPEYPAYVEAHLRELVDRYEPEILWNNAGLPAGVSRRRLIAYYHERVPDGVAGGRWHQPGVLEQRRLASRGGARRAARRARRAILDGELAPDHADVPVSESVARTRLHPRPWELVLPLGSSFAFNAATSEEHYLSATGLIHLLADVVSKNGNLLLGVAPDLSGAIPDVQRRALTGLAEWLVVHGEAIYGTRPWHAAEGVTAEELPVRYTTTDGALYAIVLGRPRMLSLSLQGLNLKKMPRPSVRSDADYRFAVRILGCERPVNWQTTDDGVSLDIPGSFVPGEAMVVKFAWEPVAQPSSGFYTDVI